MLPTYPLPKTVNIASFVAQKWKKCVVCVGADFFRQLSFVHSLHVHRKEVDDICCTVVSKSDQIRRASRLNLFQHAKPHKRFVPAASSLELPSS